MLNEHHARIAFTTSMLALIEKALVKLGPEGGTLPFERMGRTTAVHTSEHLGIEGSSCKF
jgi:hypothetical protein